MPADQRGAWLPLMVVVGVQDAGKDARGPAWRVAAADGGGRCIRMRARMPADRRGAWLPLMVGVGVLAGSPDLHTQALSRCDGRWGGKHPAPSPRDLDTLR